LPGSDRGNYHYSIRDLLQLADNVAGVIEGSSVNGNPRP